MEHVVLRTLLNLKRDETNPDFVSYEQRFKMKLLPEKINKNTW